MRTFSIVIPWAVRWFRTGNRQSVFRSSQVRSSTGYTLIEVMAAMTILAVGLLAIAQMQVIALRSNAGSREVTEATTLAEERLEFLKVLSADDPNLIDVSAGNNGDLSNSASPDHTDPGNPLNGRYTIAWNIADGEDSKSIAVIVSWTNGPHRIAKQVVMPSVIAD